MLEHALEYLARGLPIFPVCSVPSHTHRDPDTRHQMACTNPGKVPLVSWKKYQSVLPTEAEVRQWWARWPDANIGLATGKLSGFVVLDLDGELAVREAQARGYEQGPYAFTGRVGGQHRYFAYRDSAPRDVVKKSGIDVLGEGDYVVLPPSRHVSGNTYTWGEPLDDSLPPLPEWVDALAASSAPPVAEPRNWADLAHSLTLSTDAEVRAQAEAAGHTRNAADAQPKLVLPAVDRVGDVLSVDVAGLHFAVDEYNPLSRTHFLQISRDGELVSMDRLELAVSRHRASVLRGFRTADQRQVVDRVLQHLHAEHRTLLATLRTESEPLLLNGADVVTQPVRWLWPGRVPRGKLCVFEGDPGLGKSLASLDLAARLSTGRGLPDGERNPFGGEPRATLVLSAEDDPADTILPRFLASGGDPTFLTLMQGVKGPDGEHFPNLADVPALERALARTTAVYLIIDPLSAYVPAQSDAWRDDAIRRLLVPIVEVVARLDVGLTVIRHLTKDNHRPAIYRGQASIGIAGAARAVFVFGKDPNDGTGQRRGVATVKFNIGVEPPTLAYTISSEFGTAAHLRWEDGTLKLTADELLGPHDAAEGANGSPTATTEAASFLKELLGAGPVASKEIFRAARDAGVSRYALLRGKDDLKVIAHHDGPDGSWRWHLPASDTHVREESDV
jgi:hypothetical protein